ncbi:serum response factor-binding protein 1 isoform X2 [Pseudophryne corroboree]|uniref:serum response factor-binding protein 1 isoform X2 n=1 Tax=Pseudophryne corroboree TaxID=495146 RepID=UPI0030817C57
MRSVVAFIYHQEGTRSRTFMVKVSTVVKMRKDVKRVKVLTIRKLTRHIAKLKSKKGTEELKLKNQRRAQRLLEEIHTIKALKPDDVTKTALRKEINFDKVFNKADSTAETRAITRLATNPVLKQKISAIKDAIKAFKEARKNLVEGKGEEGQTPKASKPVQNVSARAANKCKQETAELDQTAEETNKKQDSLDNIDILGKVPDFIDRVPSHEENDRHSQKTALEKLSQTAQEVSTKENTIESVAEKKSFKKRCEMKALEIISEKKAVEGICEKKDSSVQVSDIGDSDKEAKEYFDCVKKRFYQELSDSDDSDIDSEDNSSIEKADRTAETRAKARQAINQLQKKKSALKDLIRSVITKLDTLDTVPDFVDRIPSHEEGDPQEAALEKLSQTAQEVSTEEKSADSVPEKKPFKKRCEKKAVEGISGKEAVEGISGKEAVEGISGKEAVEGICGKKAVEGISGKEAVEGISGKEAVEGISGKEAVEGISGKEAVEGICGKKAVEGISGKKAVEGISGKEAVKGICGKKATSVQENDSSDIEDSDKEDKEYFDDSTEERFYKQPSDFDDSDSDSEDDFFIGKVRQTKKKKSNKICSDRKIKTEEVQPKSTKSTASCTVQQKGKAAPKTVKLESVFCKSLSETKPKSPYMKRAAVANAPSYRESQVAPKMVSRGPGYLESKSPPVRNKKSAVPQSRNMIRKHQPVRGAVVKPQGNLQEQTLHPSWEASRKRKAQSQIAVFQGKKIVFDD